MHTTYLRKVGASVMLSVPPAILEMLRLKAGAAVEMSVERGRLVIRPKSRPRYTLAELLANSNYPQRQPASERGWVDAPTVGREL
jgi:antitoxin ChpS